MKTPQKIRLLMSVRSFYIRILLSVMEAHNRLCGILCKDRMQMTRLIIAVSSITWGVGLLEPVILFTPARTTYSVMAAIMPENAWGMLFMISGVAGLWSLLLGNRNKTSLVLDSLLGALLWSSSTLACFAAHWPHNIVGWFNQLAAYPAPVAMSGEVWLSVAAWWHFVRHVADAGLPNHTRRDDQQ